MSLPDLERPATVQQPAWDPRYLSRFETLHGIRVPSFTRVLAAMLLVAIVGVVALAWFTPWVQTASGYGEVTDLDPAGRLQDVTALVSGRVGRWYVQEGSRVQAGDPLVEIVDNDPQLVERLEAELVSLESELAASRLAAETAILDLERQQRLYERGLSARRDFEAARIRHQELEAKASAVEARLTKFRGEAARRSSLLVRAPRDGTILQIRAGDSATFVKEGELLATFAPERQQRAVALYLNGLDAAITEPGAQVRLIFEGWPAVQFSGWPAVAVGVFDGTVRSVDPVVSASGRFRAIVVENSGNPWPEERYLRLGAKARGWVLLGEVRLGYEIWRRLNQFPPDPVPGQLQTAQGGEKAP
jgi:multidrug efflux pump subunit AcrA (membrane-fusion protein)